MLRKNISTNNSIKTVSSVQNERYIISIPKLKLPKMKRLKLINKYVLFVVIFILITVLSGFSGAWLEDHILSQQQVVLNGGLSNQKQIVTSDSQLITEIARTVGPSVVSINDTISSGSNTSGNSLSNFGLFGFVQPQTVEQAAGTGIILTSSGLIITNRHVVPAGSSNINITLSNGYTFKNVSVVGRSNNPSLDIAFLQIRNLNGQKLKPVVLGDSSEMQVGDPVVAIGNALGQFQNTVTSGIISGYGRNIVATSASGSNLNQFGVGSNSSSSENLSDLFQTDAAINEGNSGGPLVNLNGQVIGINVAIAGNAQNIGFSIPINDVKGIIDQILKTGKFALPYLGIRYIPLTSSTANQYHLNVQYGAFIPPTNSSTSPSIIPNSPASKAGLDPGDVITAINGTQINQGHSLDSLLYQFAPGDSVTLTVLRNNKSITISVTLGSTT